ncbi:hypothetical protein [Microbacterium amylolyticum]|uniref:Uncharacterized protein n=1 Tax=Microbacterium amylolyticum TaxID=936337 RepID=A0ABS4ZE80_9MICO|nr:hypothetical protein [Microbacterium amylolyticum]MBP2435591.1 hypothetical protein [Microbacterium amylolyticum]
MTELPTPPPGDGELTPAALAMVLDPGSGPELCLGAIAESYPPQCSGPAIIGWTWPDDDDVFDEASGVQWGTFRVSGTYVAEAAEFTLTEAVPSDGSDLLSAGVDGITGTVQLSVVLDDGSLQATANERYGDGVVVVNSALVPIVD